MSLASSLSSIEEEAHAEEAEDPTLVEKSPPAKDPKNPPTKQHRHRRNRLRRRKGDRQPSEGKGKGVIYKGRCRSALKGSCLILIASLVELLGCSIALVYGLIYIRNAIGFYKRDLDTDPEEGAEEYIQQLERVLYLGEHSIGFVGLLSTCVIGLIISFLMVVGTIYKSWKCLRTSLSLLFSVSLIQLIISAIYLYDTELMGFLAVIPFRLFEFFLIRSYIHHCKKKKLEELKARVRQAGGSIIATSGLATAASRNLLDNGSLCSFDKEELLDLAGMKNSNSGIGSDVPPVNSANVGISARQSGELLSGRSAQDDWIQQQSRKTKVNISWRNEDRGQRSMKYHTSLQQYDIMK